MTRIELLNLLESISIGGNSITHEYTFSGEKIKKTGEEERVYIGSFEFRNDTLSHINIPNGRILKDTIDSYQYNLTDHLGNVVVLFEDVNGDGEIAQESEVVQRNHYYSFGLRVEMPQLDLGGYNANRYLYTGKELESDYELGWLMFKFRGYDPALGRFPSVDPIADRFAFVNPFNYAENSPIANIDLWGLQAVTIHGTNSDNKTFSDNPKTLPILKKLSGNKTINNDFNWPEGTNGLLNDEGDRKKAATALAKHVLEVHEKSGEKTITLIAHSHGGNVAIQAIDEIRDGLKDKDVKINLITIATPAYNGKNDSEDPANTSVDSHIHFWSERDGVQRDGANIAGSKNAEATYKNDKTQNVVLKDYKVSRKPWQKNRRLYKRGRKKSHSPHYYEPELLKIPKGKVKN